MAKYRVLAGRHLQDEMREVDGELVKCVVSYGPGEILESKLDLCKRYNSKDPNFPRKFEAVDGVATGTVADIPIEVLMEELKRRQATGPADDTLESMDMKELMKAAEEEEIDTSACTTPEQVRELLRHA